MKSWAPIWSTIVDSSIWDEDDFVVKVFLTMLALKDADHIVRLNAYQIAKRSGRNKSEVEVLEALKVLSSPDTKRVGEQEFEGRRIKMVEEGWLVLNGDKYRSMVQLEMKRARARKAAAVQREKQRVMDEIVAANAERIDPESLSPAQRKRYNLAMEKEYKKRSKLVEHQGACAGAVQAINDGLREA